MGGQGGDGAGGKRPALGVFFAGGWGGRILFGGLRKFGGNGAIPATPFLGKGEHFFNVDFFRK